MPFLHLFGRRFRYWPLYAFLILCIVSCGQPTQQPDADEPLAGATAVPSSPQQSTIPFSDQSFHIALPDWPEAAVDDENTLIGVSQNGQAVAIARFENVPRIVGVFIADVLPQYGPFQNIMQHVEQPDWVWLEMDIASDTLQRTQMHFVYCDGFTYQITGSAPASHFADFLPLFEQLLAVIQCDYQPETAVNQPGLMGLSINPAQDDFNFASYRQAIVTARAAGVQASHMAVAWGDVEKSRGEYDWTVPDLLLDTLSLEGIRLSLVLTFIHTSLPGSRPADLVGLPFDDPVLIERATQFVTAVIERYGMQIDYLAFGNEVNIYLADHPEQVEPFLTLFAALETAATSTAPNLPTGTTLAFHTAVQQNRFDLIELFQANDFLAYTYYPFGDGFRYDGDPEVFAQTFEQMTAVSGETPFLIVENGWATSPLLHGDESKQAAYLQATFQTLTEQRNTFMRHIWYNLHDGQPENCATAALSFVESGTNVAQFAIAWTQFEAYLCTLGLRQNDGTPKLGWDVFVGEMERYLNR